MTGYKGKNQVTFFMVSFKMNYFQKSHTCIGCFGLLTKLKITNMWRWGTPQHFLLAFTDELWKTWKTRILKKWKKKKKKKKNCWRYHHFTHVYEQPQSYKAWLLSNGVRQTEFFVIFGIFFPFTPLSISAS